MDHKFPLRLIAQFRLDPAGAGDANDGDDGLKGLEETIGTDTVEGTWAKGQIVCEFSRSASSLEQAIRGAIADVQGAIPMTLRSPLGAATGVESGNLGLLGKPAIIDALISELAAWIETNQFTYIDAADTLEVSLQQVIDVCSRNHTNLTIDTLVDMLVKAGKGVHLEVSQSPRRKLSLSDLASTPSRTDDEIREAFAQGRIAELKPDQA